MLTICQLVFRGVSTAQREQMYIMLDDVSHLYYLMADNKRPVGLVLLPHRWS